MLKWSDFNLLVLALYVSRLNHFALKKKRVAVGEKTVRRPQPGRSFEHNGCSWMDCILHCTVEVSTDNFAIILAMQIELCEPRNERSFLRYREDVSKNPPRGLKGRKFKPKVVVHYSNPENPQRCFVEPFKRYNSLCPHDRPSNAFYLSPLTKPKQDCWFSRAPLGHNTLKNMVKNMCKKAGIQGFRTNHSLRATTATRLYSSGVDKQLVMERTGHRSIEGIRSYKRTSLEQHENISDILHSKKSL